MREVKADDIKKTVELLCIEANYNLPQDVLNTLKEKAYEEVSETGIEILNSIIENAEIAKVKEMPICQDTGIAVIFVEIGQDVHVVGGSLDDAINNGVKDGYLNGYLRKSIVNDPFVRINTNDNTPPIVHYDIVGGDKLKITVAPKGAGSENMSALKMMKPSDGIEGVKKFIIDTVEASGPNACPPLVVGVGIGGNFEYAPLLAKKALLRPIDQRSSDGDVRALEEELLLKINSLGIGPQGLGGRITALAVNIEKYPTHIAMLPVAVNISCHVTRHATAVL
ncbi:fumarate hydratase [Thermoanaerobacterium thermosaccharolyticum]|uniref:Hydro-lyase, Fe-S type, tartrate/fumarate subfamily, alpha subunit n=1 Tax=Thermoanaerobacterium thermosaccharolyticum TaxID=1517 RepID=A0A223HYG8_THETR|nr:fumarate hydratase [Thermoanaerobacterium thermosaccharolyticum]AST57511.1 hydro-lyase, Fe-S type, tartrate/fumarate subfamily, alpha subunit [Thermoanaerobacterium thermosaccharolyticum]MBE0067895.1 fumarate hydratase [Thermoanaerobacterium thermosaccharolyticum]MBE0227458.1 fumarate hydratase [Thermoanaerobacterium thermosaccharolyticum]PHO06128.1 fumarate hydratase [Thermoanaerobacterium thermosaccharolyticum]